MADVMIGKTNVSNMLREEYKKLGTGWVALLTVPIEKTVDVNAEAIKILLEELDYQGIYITVDKPYPDLVKLLSEKGIDPGKLYFVDAISQMYGKTTKAKKCVFISGPLNIDAITAAVYDLLPQIPGKKKFVFIDSISSILLYNSLPRTVRFSQFITQKLKKMEIAGIMVSVSKGIGEEKLVKELGKQCDKIIDITSRGPKEVKGAKQA